MNDTCARVSDVRRVGDGEEKVGGVKEGDGGGMERWWLDRRDDFDTATFASTALPLMSEAHTEGAKQLRA